MKKAAPNLRKFFLRPDILAFVACIILFLAMPNLDLKIASLYYKENSFYLNDNLFVQFIYWFFARIHALYLLAFIGAIIYGYYRKQHAIKKKAIFLLLCAILGPGIIVNLVLKDNSLGRPRPRHIEALGGEMIYSPPFYYSGECKRNCSFVSGHAAIAFFLLAFAWVRHRRIWLVYGVALGLVVGFVRILQGGHFLSDVIFAGWVTYFTCVAVAYKMGIKLRPEQAKEPAKEKTPD